MENKQGNNAFARQKFGRTFGEEMGSCLCYHCRSSDHCPLVCWILATRQRNWESDERREENWTKIIICIMATVYLITASWVVVNWHFEHIFILFLDILINLYRNLYIFHTFSFMVAISLWQIKSYRKYIQKDFNKKDMAMTFFYRWMLYWWMFI